MTAVCRKGNPLASQSGISRMINDLEKEWGFSLLERCHAGVRLTGAGEKLLPYAQHFCDGYMDLQSEVDALRGARTGKIRIGVFSSVATHWMPAVIKAFQHDYPLVDYELLLGDYKRSKSGYVPDGSIAAFLSRPWRRILKRFRSCRIRFLPFFPKITL